MGKLSPRKSARKSGRVESARKIPKHPPARTPLGAQLRLLRAQIEKSGIPLLDWDQLRQEVQARRGGAAAADE